MTRQEYNRKILGLEKRIKFLEGIMKKRDIENNRLQEELNEALKSHEELGNDPIDAFSDLDVELHKPTKGKLSRGKYSRKAKG